MCLYLLGTTKKIATCQKEGVGCTFDWYLFWRVFIYINTHASNCCQTNKMTKKSSYVKKYVYISTVDILTTVILTTVFGSIIKRIIHEKKWIIYLHIYITFQILSNFKVTMTTSAELRSLGWSQQTSAFGSARWEQWINSYPH